MARGQQRVGDLRERIRVERRSPLPAGDGAGNFEDAWVTLIAGRAARIAPTTVGGGEEVVAGRLAGVASYDIWLRADAETKQINAGDRVVDTRNEARIFNIRWIGNLDERGQFLLLQCQAGAAIG